MAYRQPGVTVTEDFTGVTPALALFNLTNINVGPAFQVVSLGSAGAYTGSSAPFSYPGQIAGSLVDTRAADPTDLVSYPVAIYLSNTVVSYLTSVVGVVSSGNLNQLTDATTNEFQLVAAGDVIVVTGSSHGNNGSYTVRTVVNVNTIQTNETFAAAETGVNYTIRRNLQATDGNISIPSTTSGVVITQSSVTLPAGLQVTDPSLGLQVVLSATVLLSYRAQRLELSADVATFTTPQALEAAFGTDQIVPQNPLAFAAFLALENETTTTDVLALDYQYLTNELLSYADAFTILQNNDEYCINVLTQDTSVHTALNAHVQAMSQPAVKLERVGIVNRQLITTAVVVDSTTTTGGDGITGPSGGPFVTLNDTAAEFLTDGVVPGNFVTVTAPSGAVGQYAIASVNSQTQLTLVTGPVTSYTGVTYSIGMNLSTDQQASFLASYATSLGSRRLVITWPDVVVVPNGPNLVQVPGYFLGCSVGALTTALPTQQGFTNQNVAIYTGVVHSTKYFSDTQLNVIAGGGVMVFAQKTLNVTALFIRHQLTTDTSAIKFQEFSITKNVDFIAKFIRSAHQQFPGKYNIVDNAFDDLKTNASAIITYLKDSTKLPKIGGVIKSGSLTSAVQDPANIDGILESWSLDIPIPLNNLDITIFV